KALLRMRVSGPEAEAEVGSQSGSGRLPEEAPASGEQPKTAATPDEEKGPAGPLPEETPDNAPSPAESKRDPASEKPASKKPVGKGLLDKFKREKGTSSGVDEALERQLGQVQQTFADFSIRIQSLLEQVEQTVLEQTGQKLIDAQSESLRQLSEEASTQLQHAMEATQESILTTAEGTFEHHEATLASIADRTTTMLGEILELQGNTISDSIAGLTQILTAAGVEEVAREAVTKIVADLKASGDEQVASLEKALGTWEKAASEQQAAVAKMQEDVSAKLTELEDLESDIEEDSGALIERIRKYRIGEFELVEQKCERLEKEQQELREQRDQLQLQLTNVNLESGALDPKIFEEVVKQNKKLTDKLKQHDVLEIDYQDLQAEVEELRPYRNHAIRESEDRTKLAELEEFRKGYEPALERAETAAAQEERRNQQLKREVRELRAELRDLKEDRERLETLQADTEKARQAFREAEQRVKTLRTEVDEIRQNRLELLAKLDNGESEYRRSVEAEKAAEISRARQEISKQTEAACAAGLDAKQEEIDRLQALLQTTEKRVAELGAELERAQRDHEEDHRHVAGGIPEFYRAAQEEIKALHHELSGKLGELAGEEQRLRRECDRVEKERDEQISLLQQLKGKESEIQDSIADKQRESARLEGLIKGQAELLEQREKREEAKRIADKEARRSQQRQAFEPIFGEHPEIKAATINGCSEAAWLENIEKGIENSGFKIGKRLLRAFHTSLKTQDISPLTLLVGISGTGKSELPRLYADFGGLYFLPIAVQPNWDSPLDLFGFFNYADGNFRSTELTRAMLQFVDPKSPASLEDRLMLVLLDEMNLARVEYYFSDLLSRLESRRSVLLTGNPTPEQRLRATVKLDLGKSASDDTEQCDRLFLAPNVLFAGTLNQDESTLDVSDKVMDRANVVTFPRPGEFVCTFGKRSRKATEVSSHKLNCEVWERWCEPAFKTNAPDQDQSDLVANLNEKFGKINEALALVNRGVGQRVFQAVLRYILLYPRAGDGEEAIEKARKDARADQFAMKIIPKLKGLDTRSGKAAQCIKEIRRLVPEELHKTFDASKERELFEWQGTVFDE
ncbi:MAG: hypothetical protein HN341_11975, partial [Verrucomicrobia bacterium]|nr:hypothetical protein [Verrucomicrobiota bacterium]